MFEKFNFSIAQVKKYWQKASRDFQIASGSTVVEIRFVFCYESLLKIAITVCAKNNLRVQSSRGHHSELINKLAFFLKDELIQQVGNEMRSKRNQGLYSGGDLVSQKEADFYLAFCEKTINRANKYLFPGKML